MRRIFDTEIPKWIFQLPKVEEYWSAELQTLEGHDGLVHSVVFSPDGQLLASGSDDETIKLWDTTTGALQQTFQGHDSWVTSVAFSPDGQWLASGSDDKTIKLWDTATGVLQQTLNVQGSITEINFTADGLYLETNLGAFDVGLLYDGDSPTHSQDGIDICFLGQDWIALRGNKVLWLPPAYRPACVTIRHGRLAMGHASGRVSFFQFY